MIPERPGYLATRRPEGFTFSSAGILSDLGLLWQYLAEGDTRGAMFESRRLLRESSSGEPEHEAGLLAGSAEAEMRAGNPEEAERLARQSLSVFPDQWMAHGITIGALEAKQDAQGAYRYAVALKRPKGMVSWDEPPTRTEFHTLVASLAWRVQQWDDAARHIALAYPEGIESMPEDLIADWFRLAFYRDNPLDAAQAAGAILSRCTVDELDDLLNAMVQNGWTSEALPLYRTAFTIHDDSELLRRRLVGLCIREGALDEARKLASSGALTIAV